MVKIKKHSEIIGILLSVLFSNDDIFIICGNPMFRRKFFDMFLSIMNKEYLINLKKYQLLLKQKNFILKSKNNFNLLDIYDEQISHSINYIYSMRIKTIKEINPIFQEKFSDIPKNRILTITLDHKKLVTDKKSQANGSDIKLVWDTSGGYKDVVFWTENNWDLNNTKIAFILPEKIKNIARRANIVIIISGDIFIVKKDRGNAFHKNLNYSMETFSVHMKFIKDNYTNILVYNMSTKLSIFHNFDYLSVKLG